MMNPNKILEHKCIELFPKSDESVLPPNVEPGFEGSYRQQRQRHEEYSTQTRSRWV